MEYDSRVNERLMQTTEEKVDSSKALDASLVIIESNGTESQKQDTSSRSGNDAHHTEQPESNNEGEVDQNADQCYDTCPLPAKLTDNTTIELSNQLLESENVCLKKTVAQFQKDFGKLEAHCINLELQLQMENNVLISKRQQSQFLKGKADQASVFMAMTSVHISSGLVLHQMTFDHNRSELGIQDHSNEQSSSKLVPKVVP
ncbi:hypothetical protein Tco_0265183 [Tanacetum coccineum]